MAFENDFNACQQDNCNTLVITDASNGWVATVAFANVTSATIQITDSNSTSYTYDVTSVITGASTTDDLVYEIDDVAFGDGSYTIVYTIVDSGTTTYTKTSDYYFYCNIKCCVEGLLADIKDYYNCSNCDDKYINNALLAKALLGNLMTAAKFINITLADDLLTTLTAFCDYEPCTDC